MALAKFFEDVRESYLEGVDGRINAVYGRDPEREWKLTAATVTEAVALRGRDGILFDDNLVFKTGQRVIFEIVCARADLAVELKWQTAQKGALTTLPNDENAVVLVSKHAVSGDLVVSCGNYAKSYRVSFIAGHTPENLPDFAAELAKLTANPPAWTQTTFDRFRIGMESVLTNHKLPADFCDGIREYYLGLFHEQRREGRFVERLDRAYVQLAPFVQFSRLAALICAYHLYRINAFEAPLVKQILGRIGRVARFFSGEVAAMAPATGEARKSSRELLIVSAVDEAIIAAVEHLDEGDLDLAESCVGNADSARCEVDTQALERIHFLRHRICLRRGDARGTAKYALQLSNSGLANFRALAQSKPAMSGK